MLRDLEKLAGVINRDKKLSKIIRPQVLHRVRFKNQDFPIHSFSFGPEDPHLPTLLLTGGIHGLERIGAQLAWSLLKTSIDRLLWDKSITDLLQDIRLIVVPLVNPVGYETMTRSNGNGVDLMRNAPIEAIHETPFLLGGQRLSNSLPWYRGSKGVLEEELIALLDLFKSEVRESQCVISLDFHSGFGMKDRLWFPHSFSKKPFDHLPQLHALIQLFEETYPFHVYQIEPQSEAYLLHGDIWDYFYLKFRETNPNSVYIPLTLEMGSWLWVRKNPWQLFQKHGLFNPIKLHRTKRTFRRHILLFEFLMRALRSRKTWAQLDSASYLKHHKLAHDLWY